MQAADASFQRATDLVEGLLVNAPSSQVKSGMIGALGQIYWVIFAWHGTACTMVHTPSQSLKVRVVVPCWIRSDTPDNPLRLTRSKPAEESRLPSSTVADARQAD